MLLVMLHTRLLCVLGGIFHILRLIFLQATLNWVMSFSFKLIIELWSNLNLKWTPSWILPGFCPRGSGVYSGWFCRGGLCLGCFVGGFVRVVGIYQGVLSGGVCPGGFVRGGFVRGFCPGVFCPRGVLSIGGFCPAEYCPWGFVRGICSGGGGGCPRIIFLCRGKGWEGGIAMPVPATITEQTNKFRSTNKAHGKLTDVNLVLHQ